MSKSFEETIARLASGTSEEDVESTPVTEMEEMLPVVYNKKETALPADHFQNPDFKDDYEAVRSNLYGLMGKTNAAIELLLKMAKNYESPKAIDTVSVLVEASTKIGKELLAIHKNQPNKGGTEREKCAAKKGVTNIHQTFYATPGPAQKTASEELSDVLDELPDNDN